MPSKTEKFQQNSRLANLWQHSIAGKIQTGLDQLLTQNKSLILELGCGGGNYALALAGKNPKQNIIGIDIQGERPWHGATRAQAKNLTNVFSANFH